MPSRIDAVSVGKGGIVAATEADAVVVTMECAPVAELGCDCYHTIVRTVSRLVFTWVVLYSPVRDSQVACAHFHCINWMGATALISTSTWTSTRTRRTLLDAHDKPIPALAKYSRR